MFYEKPMASKLVTPAESAMGRTQRDQIVANDVTRMMWRISPKLVDKETDEIVKVLDNANNKLKLSGYKFTERHHIIESGIAFYNKRKQTGRERGGRAARGSHDESEVKWGRTQRVEKGKERTSTKT